MSERKVLNKYYPPDYDPSKIPKGKRNKNATFNIRIMAPFNMRCNMCKEYIYKGKKFNSRKEDVMDEDYLGLKIFRFYIKCPRCVSEIAFKTDLQNTDYTLEAGAKRLFEAEKIAQQMAEEERKAKEEEEMNPMKLLENRTKASRQEMDQIDTLEELRELNTRKNLVNTDEMIEKYRKYEEMLQQLQMEKEEEEIKEIFGDNSGKVVKRLNDSDSDEDEPLRKKVAIMDPSAKPTDILAGDSKEETKPKPVRVWEKSVGGISSKQKLKGLVAVKKKTALPSATFSKPPDSDSNCSSRSCISDGNEEDNNKAILKSEQSLSSSAAKNDLSGNICAKINGMTRDTNHEERAVKNEAVNKNSVSGDDKVSRNSQESVVSKPAGAGLLALGAYSDSESDTSE